LTDVSEQTIALYFKEEVFQIAVCVRVGVSKVDIVIVMGKGIVPRERKERFVFSSCFAVSILVVLDIVTTAMPTQVLQLRLLLRINNNLHAHLVEIIYLVLIQDLELDPQLRSRVRHLEEKPL